VTIAGGALVETFASGTALVHGAIHNSGGTLFASEQPHRDPERHRGQRRAGRNRQRHHRRALRRHRQLFFAPTGRGGLIIADMSGSTAAYNRRVSGFGGMNHTNRKQFIDLTSVFFSSGQIHLSYSSATGSGTLSVVSSATLVAQISMIGNYTSANFSATADSGGKVQIVDPAVVNGGSVALGDAFRATASTCRT
jgi:hypothetical protein